MRYFLLSAIALVCVGCGDKADSTEAAGTDAPKPDVQATEVDEELVFALEGPGGSVALGDDLEAAKAAFPAPDDAMVFDTAMGFTILGIDGWAWSDESDDSGFEVGIENGEVIAMIKTLLTGEVSDDEIDEQRKILGTPSAEAVSENAAMLVWESGDNARFFIAFRKEIPIFGAGAMILIGPKEKLRMLNYHYDNPQLMVDQIDAAANIDFSGN